jgi:hypothetical protein
VTKKYDVISVVGKGPFTEVRDARGTPIQNWYGINIAARPGKRPVIQLNMVAGAFNLEGTPTFMAADLAGGAPKAVKSIEFWDGTGLKFPAPPPTSVVMQQPPQAGATMAPPAAAPANDEQAARQPPGDAEKPPIAGAHDRSRDRRTPDGEIAKLTDAPTETEGQPE